MVKQKKEKESCDCEQSSYSSSSDCCGSNNTKIEKKTCCGINEASGTAEDNQKACCDAEKIIDPINECCNQNTEETRQNYFYDQFIQGFLDTEIGSIPRVKAQLTRSDKLGTFKARMGIKRNQYAIKPGLYALGNPGKTSPVLLTANYKLSFDTLRCQLAGTNSWILVLNTVGINVWCAAGKGTFSTDELISKVKQYELEKIVDHRRLILPQLSATGVAAYKVKEGTGFTVIWGPIRANDVQQFLDNRMKADESMRQLTFTARERAVLVPVEVKILLKKAALVSILILLLSGIGPDLFSLTSVWSRGIIGIMAGIIAICSGAIITPILLPWIPGTAFSTKGAITGVIMGSGFLYLTFSQIQRFEAIALILFIAALSSYLTMNFTGATPFTSPSGVEKEMRRSIPIQLGAVIGALVIWIASAFIN